MQAPAFELSAALCDELTAFRRAVLDGRSQIQLPAAVRAQLAKISLDADALAPPLVSNAFAQKRHRIEQDLAGGAASRGRDVFTGELDVDEIFGRVQARVAHTSGLRTATVAPPSPRSSFDENDYYSSQVESAWSPAAVGSSNTTTLDTEGVPRKKRKLSHLDAVEPEPEEDYVPADPIAAAAGNQEEEDYEPSDSTRDDSDYEPDAVSQAAFSPPVPIVKNHLTHLAAPQASRVSPLTTSTKGPGFELQLVDGRPEMVKVPRKMAPQARLSSASPPAKLRGKRLKKQRRENEPLQGKKKKKQQQSERHMGLDMSNQIMPRSEPQPPVPYIVRPQTAQTRAFSEMLPPPPPPIYAPPGYALIQPAPTLRPYAYNVEAPRPPSTILQAPPSAHSTFTTVYAQPPPEHMQYAAPMQQVPQVRYAMAPPPQPVQPARRIVVDQFGNRYIEDAEPSPVQQEPMHHQIMRPMTVAPSPVEQYDPANARFDMQPRPTPPAYPVEYIDGRRYRVREYVDNGMPHFETPYQQMPPAPEYRPY